MLPSHFRENVAPPWKIAVPPIADPHSKCGTPPKKCSTGFAKSQNICSRHNLHFYTSISMSKKWGVLQKKKPMPHKPYRSQLEIGSFNLDAGQPEVIQRGSPWYEKKMF